MEIGQLPEQAPATPSRNIFSAVERVGAAARHGREKVAEKIRGAKIGALGLTVGSAFFLAACGGEAQSPQSIAALPPTPPGPELQAPSDGSILPHPEERKSLERDVDTLISSARKFLNENYFKSRGWDFNQIAGRLKSLSDTELAKLTLKNPGADTRRFIQTGRLTRDGYRPLQFTNDLPFSSQLLLDETTGEIVQDRVSFYVDDNGNLVTYREDFPYVLQAQTNFAELIHKLSVIIKPPVESKPGSTLEELNWQITTSLKNPERHRDAVIKGDESHTIISIDSVGNGLNLVTVGSANSPYQGLRE